MNFKIFLLIFALSIFLSKILPIFTDISDISINPSTGISVITDIFFLAFRLYLVLESVKDIYIYIYSGGSRNSERGGGGGGKFANKLNFFF